MSFERPWLLLLALLPVLAFARGPRSLSRALQLVGAVALAVAVAGPRTGSTPRPTVLALDRSASIGPRARSTEDRWTARCPHACSAIAFALGVAPVEAGSVEPAPGGGAATSLARGIATAVDASPKGGRVIVLSDGVATDATDAGTAIAAARLRDVEIDGVPLVDPTHSDTAVTRAATPSAVHAGDTVPLLLTIHASASGRATLSVARDGGRATSEQIIVHRGDNVLTLAYVARTRGWHSFRVAVRATGDTVPQNDSIAATVDVGAPPTALVAAPDGNSVVARELAASGVAVATGPLPARPTAYRGYDLVVLDDVRRSSLTSGQVAALSTAVRFSGTGLFVTGGPRSLSLGGYAGSPLDALLPVTSRTPGQLQRRDLALELAVDRSGSMSDRAGGVPKIAMAQRAALAATDFAAAHRDELGVVDFDIRPHVGVPLGRVSPSNHKAVAKRIERTTAAGGTDIYLGLQRALEQIARSHAPKRHLILLSDGISQPHDYTTLLARLRRAHVTVAAIALGSSADVDLLRSIADATGGNFYATANARALPRIFAREARLSSAPAKLTGRLHVAAVASSPVLRSLVGRSLPTLTAVAATDAKPTAQVDLLAGHGRRAAPALAQWQVGTGRVVVWTSTVGSPWAARWGRERALWNDAARWAARPPAPAHATVTATASPVGRLTVDTAGAGGLDTATLKATVGSHPVRLVESEPAVYTADIRLRPGVDPVRVAGGGPTTLVAIPYPDEYRPPIGDTGGLGAIVAAAGGRLLSPTATNVVGGGRRDLATVLLLAGLVLYGAGVAVSLTPASKSGRRRSRAGPRAARRP